MFSVYTSVRMPMFFFSKRTYMYVSSEHTYDPSLYTCVFTASVERFGMFRRIVCVCVCLPFNLENAYFLISCNLGFMLVLVRPRKGILPTHSPTRCSQLGLGVDSFQAGLSLDSTAAE